MASHVSRCGAIAAQATPIFSHEATKPAAHAAGFVIQIERERAERLSR
jgi:hypothetical protein